MWRRTRAKESHRDWKYYGSKGITVCDEWKSFEPFRDWALANGFKPELQLDRIDGDGHYSPSNCRWVTPFVNVHNRILKGRAK
jgi:hypothetical protein